MKQVSEKFLAPLVMFDTFTLDMHLTSLTCSSFILDIESRCCLFDVNNIHIGAFKCLVDDTNL